MDIWKIIESLFNFGAYYLCWQCSQIWNKNKELLLLTFWWHKSVTVGFYSNLKRKPRPKLLRILVEILVLQSSINLFQKRQAPLVLSTQSTHRTFSQVFQHGWSYMIFPPVNVSKHLRRISPAWSQGPQKSPACQCFQFTKISPKTKTNAVAATTSNWVFRARLLCSPSWIIHPLFPSAFFFFFFSKNDGG